jgi:hypothetical protein
MQNISLRIVDMLGPGGSHLLQRQQSEDLKLAWANNL